MPGCSPLPSCPLKLLTLVPSNAMLLGTARSAIPSPLKSPAVSRPVLEAVGRVRLEAEKLPPPVLVKTLTVAALLLPTAKSGRPSPLKSPTATDVAPALVPKLRGAWKVPSPLLSKMLAEPGSETLKVPARERPIASLLLTTTMSVLPSPLKSAVRIDDWPPPHRANTEASVTVVTGGVKVPVPVPSNMVRSSVTVFSVATAMSALPSPLKSATVSATGRMPSGMSVLGPNEPAPLPSKTLIEFEFAFAVAMSSFPSPLKSPTATPTGVVPVAKSFFVEKVPSPFPSRTLTVLAAELATTRSALPSPLKSPTAMAAGFEPVEKRLGGPKKLGTVRSSSPSRPGPNLTDLFRLERLPDDFDLWIRCALLTCLGENIDDFLSSVKTGSV